MLTNIIDSVTTSLEFAFGEPYEYYASQDITQGLTTPCFFVALVESVSVQEIGSRRKMNYIFDISYFPSIEGDNNELHCMGEALFKALEWLTLETKKQIRGSQMRYEIVDGVLHFIVHYSIMLLLDITGEIMEDYTLILNCPQEG